MFVIAGANVLNALLDPLLIFGWLGLPRMGILGAATATVLAQLLGLGVMLALVARRGLLRRHPLRPAVFRTLLGIGAPAGLQGITRPLTGMMMFGIVARFGTAATAAFGIGMRVLEVMYIYLSGLGTAAEVLSGQTLGAGRQDLARAYGRRITMIGLGLQLAVLPLVFIFARPLIALFNADPGVPEAGTSYLQVLAPMLVCVGASVAWAGAQRGAGATVLPMAAAIVANWLVKLPLAVVLSGAAGLGLTGVWLGIGASIVIEAAVLGFGYFRYRWLERKVEWH
jgi:putative MATE family efflux protein